MRFIGVGVALCVFTLCISCTSTKPQGPTFLAVHAQSSAPPKHAVRKIVEVSDQGWSEPAENEETARFKPGYASSFIDLLLFRRPSVTLDNGEIFVGRDRSLAKTTPAVAPIRKIELADLLDEFRPGQEKSDDNMRNNHTPPMRKDWDFDRVSEEQDNVQVEGWIVATKKESDNDFHVILAASHSEAETTHPDRWHLMNVEISGLPSPPNAGSARLAAARAAFKGFFVPTVPDSPASSYVFVDPVHVRVDGALFFDVDHPAGAVGPGSFKPMTAWEIHPVSKLEYLN